MAARSVYRIWCDRGAWLRNRGIQLHLPPPAMFSNEDITSYYESLLRNGVYNYQLHATRITDGAPIELKFVEKSKHILESDTSLFFSIETTANHPDSSSMRVLNVLEFPGDLSRMILVIPHKWQDDKSRARTFDEAIRRINEIIQALHYIHKFEVAYRDYLSNVGALSHVAEEEDSQPGPHSLVPPSQLEDESSHPELEHRQRQSAALNRVPLHVFATDVYYLGRMIQKQFIDGNRGYKFMKPLIENMIQEDGTLRLSMVGVRARFHKICRRLQRKKLHTRIKKRRSVELFQPLRYSRG